MFRKSSRCDTSACVEVDLHPFVKSSFSADSANCVEVGFHKAAASTGNGACVEVKTCDCDEVLIRDSKDPDGPRLSVTPAAFNAFLADIRAGVHDLP